MPTTKVPASRMISYDTGSFCFRNKIINGDMRIDQRNSGASVTPAVNSVYTVDRFINYINVASKITYQQVVDAPAGFTYSLRATVASQYTPANGEVIVFGQNIEGYNVADLNWGTPSARAITLSFWVKSSVAGQAIQILIADGSAASTVTRSYATTDFINTANTWQYITKTIPGPTDGDWSKTTGRGLFAGICLGGGPQAITNNTDVWQVVTTNNLYMSNATQFVTRPTGSTLNITGVQLEAGPTATPFEYRPIGTELALCQRYYWRAANADLTGFQAVAGDSFRRWPLFFPVTMRVAPVITGTARDQVSNFVWNSIGGSEGVSRMFATAYLNVGNSTNWTILTNAAADAEL